MSTSRIPYLNEILIYTNENDYYIGLSAWKSFSNDLFNLTNVQTFLLTPILTIKNVTIQKRFKKNSEVAPRERTLIA